MQAKLLKRWFNDGICSGIQTVLSRDSNCAGSLFSLTTKVSSKILMSVGRRKEPILGYVPKNEGKNSGGKGLMRFQSF